MHDDERGGRAAPGSVSEARPAQNRNGNEDSELSRRELLKIAGATGAIVATQMMLPSEWTRPIVDVGALPAHAQTSGKTPVAAGFTLTATRKSGDVELSWTTPAGVTSLEIYRTVDGEAEKRIAIADTAAASMVDYEVPANKKITYYGKITAGWSKASVVGAQ